MEQKNHEITYFLNVITSIPQDLKEEIEKIRGGQRVTLTEPRGDI